MSIKNPGNLSLLGHSEKQAIKDFNSGKKQFKNNLHTKQNVLLYGTEFEKDIASHEVPGKPLSPPQDILKKDSNEHYWSEYRRNYENAMKAKMEEDRLKI
jgi:hypothetical protein